MIKKPFRMSKHDLKARPIYHHERELHRSPPDRRRRGRQPLDRTGPDRPLRTIKIQAHTYTITTADPLPRDLRDALDRIHGHLTAHQFGPTQVAAELIAASARVACAPSPAPDNERRA
jgi:hypothetical protein